MPKRQPNAKWRDYARPEELEEYDRSFDSDKTNQRLRKRMRDKCLARCKAKAG